MAQQKQQAAAPASPGFSLSPKTQSMILWGLFALWAVLVCVGIAHHEQWRDEGSDWLTVRHVGIGELFGTMIPQIGHPPLYYLIMYPLGNLGLPLVTVNITCAIIMALGAATQHQVTFTDGMPVDRNFYSYQLPRITDIPPPAPSFAGAKNLEQFTPPLRYSQRLTRRCAGSLW